MLGHTRITEAKTMNIRCKPEIISKNRRGSDCTLKLACMKPESLVIANKIVVMNFV